MAHKMSTKCIRVSGRALWIITSQRCWIPAPRYCGEITTPSVGTPERVLPCYALPGWPPCPQQQSTVNLWSNCLHHDPIPCSNQYDGCCATGVTKQQVNVMAHVGYRIPITVEIPAGSVITAGATLIFQQHINANEGRFWVSLCQWLSNLVLVAFFAIIHHYQSTGR